MIPQQRQHTRVQIKNNSVIPQQRQLLPEITTAFKGSSNQFNTPTTSKNTPIRTLHPPLRTCHTLYQLQGIIQMGLITDPAPAEPIRIEMTDPIPTTRVQVIEEWISSQVLAIQLNSYKIPTAFLWSLIHILPLQPWILTDCAPAPCILFISQISLVILVDRYYSHLKSFYWNL